MKTADERSRKTNVNAKRKTRGSDRGTDGGKRQGGRETDSDMKKAETEAEAGTCSKRSMLL